MNVLLINPNKNVMQKVKVLSRTSRVRQPLDLAYVAAVLKQKAITVELMDANAENLRFSAIAKRVERFAPDCIFITTEPLDTWVCPFPEYTETIQLATGLKNISRAFIGICGPHGTYNPKEVIEYTRADCVVMGEPEYSVLDIVLRRAENKTLENIDGVAYREKNDIRVNQPRDYNETLDEIPFPAYELLPMERYFHNFLDKGRFSIMLTSRGCPAQCIYCFRIMCGTKHRTRSVDNIIEEMKLLKDTYGVGSLYFQDLEFLLDRQRVVDLCERMIKENFDFQWGCTARVTSVDEKLLRVMHQAGCKSILYGVETLDPAVLKIIKKGITYEQVRKAVELSKNIGILPSLNMMVGLPGQTMQSHNDDLKKLLVLNPYRISFGIAIPFPGTEYYSIAQKDGLIKDGSWGEIAGLAGLVHNTFTKRSIRWCIFRDKVKSRFKWIISEYSPLFFLNKRFYGWIVNFIRRLA